MVKKNLVLLGVGHTNAHVVKQWETNPIKDCQLTCVTEYPTATYSGLLPGTLARQFPDNAMRIDLSKLCERSGAKLIMANTSGLDLKSEEIHFKDHDPISFDSLSIGVGSVPIGYDTHANADSLIATKPMQTFLSRLSRRLDQCTGRGSELSASALGQTGTTKVAIVGGGVASVEIALCLHQQFEKQQSGCRLSIEIFTSSDTVAREMRPRSINYIERILKSRNINITRGHRVTEVCDRYIITENDDRHEADIVIWATGATAPPVLGKLGLETDDRGFIATTQTLQSLSDPRIFAVGDSGTIIQSPSPKAGVYAVRQCPVLWHNLQAFFDGGSMERFEPQSDFLKLLNTGDGKALMQYGFLNAHARWCWHLKTWIDKRFITQFQNG